MAPSNLMVDVLVIGSPALPVPVFVFVCEPRTDACVPDTGTPAENAGWFCTPAQVTAVMVCVPVIRRSPITLAGSLVDNSIVAVALMARVIVHVWPEFRLSTVSTVVPDMGPE